MITFTALFASLAGVLFLLWLAERAELRFWRQQADTYRRMHREASERETFWMGEALRSPFRGKPKEMPRA